MSSNEEEEASLSGKDEEEVEWPEFEEEEEEYFSKEQEKEPICRLSHPAHDPHTLSHRTDAKTSCFCFGGSSSSEYMRSDQMLYYYCTRCDVEFHADCFKWPRNMIHPYHPQHPLTYTVHNLETGMIYDSDFHNLNEEEFNGVGMQDPGNIFDNCTWCGSNLKLNPFFYRCSICNFCLDPQCSKTFPLPSIKNLKIHHHSLFFLPRPLLVPCDACGCVDKSDPSYACFQCNFIIHKSCIDLPRVIKLTRHSHRLFYTPFRSPTLSPPCRLCYKIIDVKYGHYSCKQDDCSYVVHSKCATHETIWDGKELEWEPEESIETEDVEPFKKVGDGLIKYFCHHHYLKLEKYDCVRDADKQCQACILHIDARDFYNCIECDFFLHEVCANLPRKLDHPLHNHPLLLDTTTAHSFIENFKGCSVCYRKFSGYKYKCSETKCNTSRKFQVDFGCISVPDCFTHKSHEHPLFIPIPASHNQKILCEGCKEKCDVFYLKCTICNNFALCYECATIPDKLHYKYEDDLPLSLCYGEVSLETYWCEVCEGKLDSSEWFYTCNKPYITIHRKCVFGDSAYMKPGYNFFGISSTVKVLPNCSSTRPICHYCKKRCSSVVYFSQSHEKFFCSFTCLW